MQSGKGRGKDVNDLKRIMGTCAFLLDVKVLRKERESLEQIFAFAQPLSIAQHRGKLKQA